MHPEWHDFLKGRGARFGDHDGARCVSEFDASDRTEEREAASFELTDLSALGLLSIEGPDAARFFQGYATANVELATPGRAIPSALCTREGRTIATFRFWGSADTLTLRLHRALIAPVHDLLARYIVFSKAELVIPGDDLVGIGLMGESSAEALADLLGSAPAEGRVVHGKHGAIALRARGEMPRFELWLPRESAAQAWTALEAGARRVSFSRWLAHRIRAGYVDLSPRTAGAYVPQALNLQALDQIAFDKGCYLGQEVVARMQYLGKVKKRMFRFSVAAEGRACPPLGAELCDAPEDGRVVGDVVAAAEDEGRCEMLAVVRVDAAHAPVFLDGRALKAEMLPYEVPALRAEQP